MSFGGLIHPIANLMRIMSKSAKNHKEGNNNFVIAGIILGASMLHGTYTLGTKRKEIITVNEKYQLITRGGSMQMIKTNNNDSHYAVPSSIWFWQFKSPELWRSLEAGKTYSVQSYGWRMPLLGMFPNIVDAHEISLNLSHHLTNNNDKNIRVRAGWTHADAS